MFGHFLRKGGWIVLLGLLAVAAIWGWSTREAAIGRALAERGAMAVATIQDLRTETTRYTTKSGAPRTSTSRLATYAFEVVPAGGSPEARVIERGVPEEVHDSLRVGGTVRVFYLREDPDEVEFYPGEYADFAEGLALTALFALGMTAVVAAFVVPQARRAYRIESFGIPALGTVEKATLQRGRYFVSVRFRDTEGTERLGRGSDWRARPLRDIRPGDQVAFRYDPGRPSAIGMIMAEGPIRDPAALDEAQTRKPLWPSSPTSSPPRP